MIQTVVTFQNLWIGDKLCMCVHVCVEKRENTYLCAFSSCVFYLVPGSIEVRVIPDKPSQIMCEQKTKSEKAMAPHSSTLAWKIPWTEEPGRLQSMGSLRVGRY